MALLKDIELDNGVILTYHRITSLNKITNKNNIIEVNSYINEKQREKEKEWYDLQLEYQELATRRNEALKNRDNELLKQIDEAKAKTNQPMNVMVVADYISIDYDASMEIADAYEYLKTTDKYKGAKDV